MPNVEPEVKIRLIALAQEIAKSSIPVGTPRGDAGLKRYLEYFDKAYKAVATTVASE